MSGFPSLQPAMTILIEIDAPIAVGSASKGTPLNVPVTGGSVRSHPEYPLAIDATFTGTGNDYIRNDPSQSHMRLNAHAVAKDQSEALVYLNYTGVIEITEDLVKILGGRPGAKTTDFGDSFIEIRFETGDDKLKELETGTFVGAGRFRVEEDRAVTVEYQVSRVKGP